MRVVTEHHAAESAGLFDRTWERPVQQAAAPRSPQSMAVDGQRRRDGDRPLHRARRLYRVLAPWLAVAGALVWFVALRPVALGGPTGYVVVAGTSMEPLYRTGDLVLTRRADTYRLGDVIAFGIPDGDATVIHRIVGGNAESGYVLRGDNKPGEDLWRPTPDDVLGKAVVHVPHVGAAGTLLRSPTVLGALAGAFAFLAVTAPARTGTAGRVGTTQRRGRRQGQLQRLRRAASPWRASPGRHVRSRSEADRPVTGTSADEARRRAEA